MNDKIVRINVITSNREHRLQDRINQMIYDYNDTFAKDKFDIGTVRNVEAQIKLLGDRYTAKKPYRCSIPDQREIDHQIDNLLERQLIEESSSPFSAPVTLAYKKEDGRKTRLCIDFRELNKIIVPESQPFPRIEDLLTKLCNCNWFSTLDINSAFWSIPIREKDRMKTAFVTQSGHYQWRCLPFGLKTSPAIFQRALANLIRRNGLSDFCSNYIDDIIVFSQSFEEHMEHLTKLFKVASSEGLKFKKEKCQFAKGSVHYLGHIIERKGIRPAKDNLKAIQNFERPKTKKI